MELRIWGRLLFSLIFSHFLIRRLSFDAGYANKLRKEVVNDPNNSRICTEIGRSLVSSPNDHLLAFLLIGCIARHARNIHRSFANTFILCVYHVPLAFSEDRTIAQNLCNATNDVGILTLSALCDCHEFRASNVCSIQVGIFPSNSRSFRVSATPTI